MRARFLQVGHVEKCKTRTTLEGVILGASQTAEVALSHTVNPRAYSCPILIGRNRHTTRPRCDSRVVCGSVRVHENGCGVPCYGRKMFQMGAQRVHWALSNCSSPQTALDV